MLISINILDELNMFCNLLRTAALLTGSNGSSRALNICVASGFAKKMRLNCRSFFIKHESRVVQLSYCQKSNSLP